MDVLAYIGKERKRERAGDERGKHISGIILKLLTGKEKSKKVIP